MGVKSLDLSATEVFLISSALELGPASWDVMALIEGADFGALSADFSNPTLATGLI